MTEKRIKEWWHGWFWCWPWDTAGPIYRRIGLGFWSLWYTRQFYDSGPVTWWSVDLNVD